MTSFDETNNTGRQNSGQKFTDDLKSTTREASDTAKQQATQKLDEGRNKAADEIENIAHAARAAASDLDDKNREGLSHYVTDLANQISSLASGLRKKSIDDLMQEAQNIARKNPALFIGGSIAIGLGIARFARASSHHSEQRSQSRDLEAYNPESPSGNNALASDFNSAQTTESSSLNEYTTSGEMGRNSSLGNGSSKQNGNGAGTIGGSRYE